MKIKVLLLLLVVILNTNAQDYPFDLPDNIEASINFDTESLESFNNLLLGTNIHHFSTNQEKDFVRLFDPLSVRFPHGLWSNWYDWRRDVSRLFGEERFEYKHGVEGTPRMKTVDFLASLYVFDNNDIKVGIEGLTTLNSERKFNTGSGYTMMWTFNMSADGTDFTNGCPESVARYHDLISRGFVVKDVEMGNENFYPGQRSSIIPNSEEYIARAKSMSAALKALDPNIRVSVPLLRRDSWANPNWNVDLTQDQSYFDAVTIHTYVGSDPDDASNSDEAFSTALTARKHLLASITDYPHKVTNKPIWLTEWGVKSGGPNAVSALGAVDCFLMMSENQDIFERANWFSTNGKLNSMLVWEEYIDGQDRTKERIKYPLEKTLFGSAYEITRGVLENSTLLESNVEVLNLVEGVKAVSARVVWKDGKATILALNLTDKDVAFNVSVDGGVFTDTYTHKAMAFSSVDEEIALPYATSPLTLIHEGTGEITLPKLSINTIELNGVYVKEELPSDNFKIETISETCASKNNGKININTLVVKEYNVRVAGEDYSFTKEITIENLSPGNYDFCITANEEDFEHCFSVEIESGSSISGKIAQHKNKAAIAIESGVGPYSIIKNGNLVIETSQKHFSIDVVHGDKVEVKGAFDCQGSLLKNIDLLSEVKAYPNPTTGEFEILVPLKLENVHVQVFDMYSKLIINKNLKVLDGSVSLDISSMARGMYMVKLNLSKPIMLKVMKN